MVVIMDRLFLVTMNILFTNKNMKKTQKIDVEVKSDDKHKVVCPKCKKWGGNFYEDYALTIIKENVKCPFCKKVVIEKTKFYEK